MLNHMKVEDHSATTIIDGCIVIGLGCWPHKSIQLSVPARNIGSEILLEGSNTSGSTPRSGDEEISSEMLRNSSNKNAAIIITWR